MMNQPEFATRSYALVSCGPTSCVAARRLRKGTRSVARASVVIRKMRTQAAAAVTPSGEAWSRCHVRRHGRSGTFVGTIVADDEPVQSGADRDGYQTLN